MQLAPATWLLVTLFTIPLAAENLVVGSDSASCNTVISTGSRRTEVVVPVNGVNERVCWFDGQKYSKGARIKAGNEWLVCARENEYETNGALIWRPVTEVPTNAGNKIQIN